MQLSIGTNASAHAEPAAIVWLRRLLDLGLGGFAFSLGFRIAPAQIFLIVTLVAVLALHLCGVRLLRRTALDVPLALYVVAVITGVVGSTVEGASVFAPDTWGVYRLAACILLVGAIGNAERGWRLAQIFVVAAALQGAYGFVQHFTGVDLFDAVHRMKGAPGGVGWLASGTYTRNTTLAFVTTASLALVSAALMAGALEGRTRIAAVLITLPTGLGQLMTFVRTAWLALVGALGTMSVIGRRGLKAAVLLLGLFAALVAGVLATSASTTTETAVAPGNGTWHRGFIWARSLEMLSDHPVTGIGAGAFEGLTHAYYDAMHDEPPVRCHAHNNLLFVWTESGPLGLIAFVWLFVSVLAALRRGIKRAGEDRRAAALIMGSAGVVTIFLAWTLTQDPLYDGMIAYTLAFCMALGMAAVPRDGAAERAPADEAPDARSAPRGSAAVAAIAMSLAVAGGLSRLGTVGRAEAQVAALLLGLLAVGYLPFVPAALAIRVRGLATLAGAVALVARAFSVVAHPGSEAWWSTPSALASVAAITAGLAGSAWAMRRPGAVGPAAVAGALAAGWIVGWVGALESVLLPYLDLGFNPDRPFSFNFALGGCAAAMLFVAWAGPLGFGEGPVLGWAERLRRLPTAAVAVCLAVLAAAGFGAL